MAEKSRKSDLKRLVSLDLFRGLVMFLLVAEGESVPGPILQIGNTNSRYRFSIGAREFMNKWSGQGPSHHCAIGIGHIAHKLDKLGKILEMGVVKIC